MLRDVDIDDCIPLANDPPNVVLHDISLPLSVHVLYYDADTYQPAVMGFQLVGDWMGQAHDLRPAYVNKKLD